MSIIEVFVPVMIFILFGSMILGLAIHRFIYEKKDKNNNLK